MTKILEIIIFNYGIGFLYNRYKREANPNSEKYDSDGSIPKFRIRKIFNEYSDWQIAIKLFWNHSFIFRIYLNR